VESFSSGLSKNESLETLIIADNSINWEGVASIFAVK
jgi:hypothetical protein